MHRRHYDDNPATPSDQTSGFAGFTLQPGDTAAVLPRAGAFLARTTGASRRRGARSNPTHQDPRLATWRVTPSRHQAQVDSTVLLLDGGVRLFITTLSRRRRRP